MMNAYDSLLNQSRSAKKRRRVNNRSLLSNKGGSRFFPCPAGCGLHICEREVNAHLDRGCLQLNGNNGSEGDERSGEEHDAANKIKESTEVKTKTIPDNNALPQSTATAKPKKCTNSNAFHHMMKKSAQVYSNNDNINQRFHLHNDQGMVSWTYEDDKAEVEVGIAKSDHINNQDSAIQWSTSIILKKVKTINIHEHGEQKKPLKERSIQLTVSSSIPSLSAGSSSAAATSTSTATNTTKSKLPRLVQQHSHLSISHLKSCLQKSIRRRAPLPAVRVAMELADKSWTDLIRRLPIIILEDSTLHPDVGLLVWLMIADSKGYVPSKELIVKVLQIVFEIASCPWQDVPAEHSSDDSSVSATKDSNNIDSGIGNSDNTPTSFSLSSSPSTLFPTQQHKKQAWISDCETIIRAMLLRAQYGGMKCDVDMLHSFAKIWLNRFNGVHAIPATIISNSTMGQTSSTTDELDWYCIPFLIHAKAREQSRTLVTMSMVDSHDGVVALTTNDVCPAGIDFHCSQVVEHLLSRPNVYSCLCERLQALLPSNNEINRDWIASKVKQCIWNYSSGVNRRRTLMGSTKRSDCASALKRVWDDVLSSPFDDYVKKFVKDRLHVGAS